MTEEEYLFSCFDGEEHQWLPQGSGYKTWTGTGSDTVCPPDAPFYELNICAKCGTHTHILKAKSLT